MSRSWLKKIITNLLSQNGGRWQQFWHGRTGCLLSQLHLEVPSTGPSLFAFSPSSFETLEIGTFLTWVSPIRYPRLHIILCAECSTDVCQLDFSRCCMMGLSQYFAFGPHTTEPWVKCLWVEMVERSASHFVAADTWSTHGEWLGEIRAAHCPWGSPQSKLHLSTKRSNWAGDFYCYRITHGIVSMHKWWQFLMFPVLAL